jgi:hypothetical protein
MLSVSSRVTPSVRFNSTAAVAAPVSTTNAITDNTKFCQPATVSLNPSRGRWVGLFACAAGPIVT